MRLSSHDASFLYTETASGPMHGVGITVLDGPAGYREIFDYFAARVHLVPRFRQKLAFVPFNLAHPKWVDDPAFRLENHLKRHELPPGTTLEEAHEIALELGEPLLDRRRPLWLNYVIENVEGKTLLVQMAHHAFVDGATAVAMSTVLTDAAPDAPPPPAEPGGWQPAREPTPRELWFEAQRELGQALTRQILRPSRVDTAQARRQNDLLARLARPVMQAPWNAGAVGPKRTLATLEYTTKDFRAIRKTLGGTINDIVVAAVSEGAARYLRDKREVVANQHLRLMCPVNVRTTEENPLDMATGNRVSAMFPVLPAWPMDMTQRLAAVREELEGIKARGEPHTLDAMQNDAPPVPPMGQAATLGVGTPWDPTTLAARFSQPPVPAFGPRPLQAGFNFTCTNVPGPTWAQYIAGYAVARTTGTMMLGGNLGLGVSVGSFNGQFVFGFTADPRLVPDVEKLARFSAEAFAELSQLAAGIREAEDQPAIAAA